MDCPAVTVEIPLRTELPTLAREPDPAATAYPEQPVTAMAAAHSRAARGVVGRTVHQTTGDPLSAGKARARRRVAHPGTDRAEINTERRSTPSGDQLSVFTMLSAAISK